MKYIQENIFSNPKMLPTRDGFGKALVELGEINEKIVVLTTDVSGSVRANWFAEKFPQRFFDLGISEQNMISVAAGISLENKIPFATTFGVFVTGRVWDQIRVLISYSQTNVKLVGTHTGVTVGEDGATHQILEDIALMRVLPNMTVVVPSDFNETKKAIFAAADFKGPIYIRLGRQKAPLITTDDAPFEIGKSQQLKDGKDVTIVACGVLVYEALLAAEKLNKLGISARILNMHTIKPLDVDSISEAAKTTGAIVTAEEHQVAGGLGSAVAETVSQLNPVPIEMIGINDKFGISGTSDQLLTYYGLRSDNIVSSVKKVLKRKR
ncbi:MAG: transketolase family protein [Candidatus Marinimicrobia bacterium]|nr:transketolase family protein [Candidatus Neomarinimicrobiota bacterium]